MDTIQIPCPKCGSELKLRDRSLLGRKGKCPRCSHAFVLEEPEVVQLELAEPEPPSPDDAALASMEGQWLGQIAEAESEQPMFGTGTRWTPDAVAPAVAKPRQRVGLLVGAAGGEARAEVGGLQESLKLVVGKIRDDRAHVLIHLEP